MTELKPEERARQWIDRKLEDAGWQVVNRDEYAPGMTAVAVREAAMRGGLEADYLLLINGKAAAVLEAKREEIALDNPHLIAQAENYTKQVQSLTCVFETRPTSNSLQSEVWMPHTGQLDESIVSLNWNTGSSCRRGPYCAFKACPANELTIRLTVMIEKSRHIQ